MTTEMDEIDIEFSFEHEKTAEISEDEQESAEVSWWLKNWYSRRSTDLTLRTIEPDSRFFLISSTLIFIAWIYNLFYVPSAIAFEYELAGGWYFLDLLMVLIFHLDILFSLHTVRLSKIETLVLDLNKIQKAYVDTNLFLDILAAIPIEYFTLISSIRFARYILLHRIVFKIPRMV